ncbi:MAG: arginine--tRNA ligase [Cyanobacteria bacterium SIG30]|nr:arginine--tRNA ligase [Cyanobacteria bacterium SIG30]
MGLFLPYNFFIMLKNYFIDIVAKAIEKGINDNKLGELKEFDNVLVCEKPKNEQFGDFSINVSSLARYAKMAPPVIANTIAEYISSEKFDVSVVAGFINFTVKDEIINNVIKEILDKQKEYGKGLNKNPKKINLEYVSANPTGPFHIGHGRWAAVGSSLANVLKFYGDDVFQEFYINDAGNQINKLGKSLEVRVRQLKGEDIELPEDSYPGEYLIDCAKKYIEEKSTQDYAIYAENDMLNQQKELLEKFGVKFDLFFHETDLYKNNEVQKCVDELDKMGKLYKKEDAVWFKSSDYGDEQDRVIKKADGTNTYLTADIAYHQNKLKRGFDTLINIWGADHHGYIKRIEASIEALGRDPKSLEVLLGQLVNIVQNGETMRMGKRKKMVTLGDLVDEVGADATRYWMLMRSIDTALDFDVDLAKSKTDQNPVFYVQYAHARCSSIIRKATEESVDTLDNNKIIPSTVTMDEFNNFVLKPQFSSIYAQTDDSKKSVKALVLKLEEFKSVVENSAKNRAPYLLCKYAQEVAGAFHHFYNYTRVITNDKTETLSRMCLVFATKTIMQITLDLIGVSAPEKM